MILRLLGMSVRLVFGVDVVESMAGVARPVDAVGGGALVYGECVEKHDGRRSDPVIAACVARRSGLPRSW